MKLYASICNIGGQPPGESPTGQKIAKNFAFFCRSTSVGSFFALFFSIFSFYSYVFLLFLPFPDFFARFSEFFLRSALNFRFFLRGDLNFSPTPSVFCWALPTYDL